MLSILYIKEKEKLISGSVDGNLLLWNLKNNSYECQKIKTGLFCCCFNALYKIDEKIILVGGKGSFYIVNIDKCVIQKEINDISFGFVYCFIKLRDNNTILCGCEKGTFCFYDMKTGKYNITKNNHKESVFDLLLINDNTFVSCSGDKTIKVWTY